MDRLDFIMDYLINLTKLFHAGAFMWGYAACGAIFGSTIGSFTDLVADRTLDGRKWWGTERSRCPACNKILGALELIPIVSFVIQKRKCKGCGSLIPYECLWTEILCLSLYGILWGFHMPFTLPWVLGSLLIPFFMIHIITDIKTMDLCDGVTVCIFLTALAIRVYGSTVGNGYQMTDGLLGAIIASGIFLVFAMFGAMGFGDVILMLGLGMITGTKGIVFNIYIACIMCVCWYVYSLAYRCITALRSNPEIKTRSELITTVKVGREVAYGPWLCLGAYLWIVFFI